MVEERGDSIWRITSAHPGTHLLVFGAIHGNERTGIETVRHLVKAFSDGSRTLASGTLTLALANTRAMDQNERWVDGKDLNRYFTDAHLIKGVEGSWEEERVGILAKLCQEADILIDIHSTNKPSTPFACSRVDAAHERVYKWFPLDNVIEDPEYVFGDEPVTSEEYMDRIGKVGVCVETGLSENVDALDAIIRACEGVMVEHGLLDIPVPALPEKKPATYRFYKTIKLSARGFEFAPCMGTHSFQPIRAGEVLGHQGEDTVILDRDAVIVFPKPTKYQQPGKPVCYIAIPVPTERY